MCDIMPADEPINKVAAPPPMKRANDIEQLLLFAQRLADSARAATLKHFRRRLPIEAKADASPVTVADRESETVMRSLIAKTYPAHGVIGEEFGADTSKSECWVLDPIDGTRSFITGSPLYCTLIAFVRDGAPLLGVVDLPALNERWTGADDDGFRQVLFNGKPCKTSPQKNMSAATMITTTMGLADDWRDAVLRKLSAATAHTRLGGDGGGYANLAAGFADVAADYEMQPYDYLPLMPIVNAAGGKISDWRGTILNLNSGKTEVAASANADLHEQVLAVIN